MILMNRRYLDLSFNQYQGEDNVEDLPPINIEKQKNMSQNTRISVSAEVFGKYHKKESYVPTVIKKSQAIKDK